MDKKELYFPVNVIDRDDFISGFGGRELLISGIAFICAVVTSIVLYLSTGNMVAAIFTGSALLILTIVLIRRDRYDESLIDKFKIVIQYHKSQKRFIYEYYNIYEGRYADEEK